MKFPSKRRINIRINIPKRDQLKRDKKFVLTVIFFNKWERTSIRNKFMSLSLPSL